MWVINTRMIMKVLLLALLCGFILTSVCNAAPIAQGIIENVTAVQIRPVSLSLAVTTDGAPWISLYSLHTGETDGRLMAMTKEKGKWVPYLVDNVGNVGLYSSVAIDHLDVPWIAYYDVTNKSVLVAYPVPSVYDEKTKQTVKPQIKNNDPTSLWIHEGVFLADSADVGKYISIAFDNRGEPGIAAYDSGNTIPMFFALNESGLSWIPHFPSNSKDTGEYTSVTFDKSNNPWVSYVDDKNRDLIVSHREGKTWIVDDVDSAGDVGSYNSISTDPSGNVGVSYYDYTNGGLKYAYETGGKWNAESVWKGVVEENGQRFDLDVGSFTSLVYDKKGVPYITFYAASTGELMGATKINGKWNIVVIDSPKRKITATEGNYQGVGSYSSAKLLPSGDKIGVTYYDWDNGMVKYAEVKTSEFQKGNSSTKTTTTKTQTTQEAGQYSDKNVSFTYPKDWVAGAITNDLTWQYIPYLANNNGTFIMKNGLVRVQKVFVQNISDISDIRMASLKKQYPDLVIVDYPTTTKVSGKDAIKFVYTYSDDKGKWKEEEVYIASKNNVMGIDYFALPESFDADIANVQKVIDSIKLK